LFEPSRLEFWSNVGLAASNGWAAGGLATNNWKLELQARNRQMWASIFFAKCSLNLTPMGNLKTNIRWSSYFAEMLFDI
jgi:hypothetical protein